MLWGYVVALWDNLNIGAIHGGMINFTILLLTLWVGCGRGQGKGTGETPRQGVRIFPKLFQQVLIRKGMREQSIN